MCSIELALACAFAIPAAVANLMCYEDEGRAVSPDALSVTGLLNCTGYCHQEFIWNENKNDFYIKRGCEEQRKDCERCGLNGNVTKCLLTYNDSFYKLCCTTHQCNSMAIALVPPTHMLEFSWHTEFIPFALTVLVLLAFALSPFYFGWWLHREKTRRLLNQYNVPIDDTLLVHDIDEPIFNQTVGQELDGCLALADLKASVKSTVFDRANQLPQLEETYPSVTFGDFVTNLAIGFDQAVVDRSIGSVFDNVMYRMIEQGPGFFRIHPVELIDLLEQLNIVLKAEGPMIELPPDVVIVGDLRGRYCDLMRWLELHGYPPKRRYLFLGGIIDRSNPDSLETFTLIAAMKVAMPYDVFILCGATETMPFVVEKRFPKSLCNAFALMVHRICRQMPVFATIGGKILAVHSGIGKKMVSIVKLKKRELPLTMGMGEMAQAAIFNLPKKNIQGYEDRPDRQGKFFGEDVLRECAKALGIELFIRSRSACPEGHFFFAAPLMLSIWSANCKGCSSATTVSVDSQMKVSVFALATSLMAPATCASEFSLGEPCAIPLVQPAIRTEPTQATDDDAEPGRLSMKEAGPRERAIMSQLASIDTRGIPRKDSKRGVASASSIKIFRRPSKKVMVSTQNSSSSSSSTQGSAKESFTVASKE